MGFWVAQLAGTGDVFGLGVIAQNAPRNTEQPPIVALGDGTNGCFVTRTRHAHQVFVSERFGRLRRLNHGHGHFLGFEVFDAARP